MPKRRDENAPYWRRLRDTEKQMLETALRSNMSVRGVAEALGVSPNYVSERLTVLGITVLRTKPGPKPTTSTPVPPVPPITITRPFSPPPSTFTEQFLASVVDGLVEIIGLFANNVDSSVVADCRFVISLLRNGIYTPREAGTVMQRIRTQAAFGASPSLHKNQKFKEPSK
jgi:hypothetical protein